MKSIDFSIEVINKTNFFVDEKKLTDGIRKIFNTEETKSLLSGNVVIVFVEKKEIKKLNKKYRGRDYATDVLSFLYNEKDILGEVILCPEQILVLLTESKDNNQERAIYRTVIHGVLHILGYVHNNDDEEELMEKKTEKYLKILK